MSTGPGRTSEVGMEERGVARSNCSSDVQEGE